MSSRKNELTQLILQALRDLGFHQSVTQLQSESGVSLESNAVNHFRTALMKGEWDVAEELFRSLDVEPVHYQVMRFLIHQQEYLELLEGNELKRALHVLRKDLASACPSPETVRSLSSLAMCTSTEELKKQAKWDGAGGKSRLELLSSIQSLCRQWRLCLSLQEFISTSCMIPERRLEALIDQAIHLQQSNCLYHNIRDSQVSLLMDHTCDRSTFPCRSQVVLEDHTDEVWFISFSHSGDLLASASKDTTAIIWNANNWAPIYTLSGHSDAISFLAWNKSDQLLLTGSNDKTLKIWRVNTGACENTFSRHNDLITSCAWLPDGERFLSGSLDKTILLWHTSGDVLFKWSGVRVTDLSVAADGLHFFTISEKRIRIYNVEKRAEVGFIQETDSITSLYCAGDSRHVLINLSGIQEIHMWDIEERQLVRKFVGHKQDRFVIRSCFGGVNESFILSGSEDSRVYVWHRDHAVLLEVLAGHSGCVNCVSWNSKRDIFASASDDHTIRLWSPIK